MAAQHIDANNFETEVIKNTGIVVVDFYATWCGPCKILSPIIDKLSEDKNLSAKFVKVDVDQNQDLAGSYNIFSIPTIIFFKNGQVINQLTGVVSEESIVNIIQGN